MSLLFGLFSALLALGAMRVIGTPAFDPLAYWVGIGSASVLGVLTVLAVRALERRPRLRGLAWLVVPLAGGVVGMIVQAVILFHKEPDRVILIHREITTDDPELWIFAGLPMGAIAALVAAGVLAASLHVASPTGNLDSRERVALPFAGGCALVAACTLGLAERVELPAVALVLVAALGVLAQVFVADRARASWLERVFAGEESRFEVVPLAECPAALDAPAAVGTVFPRAAIIELAEAAYRGAARTPYASTASTINDATQPLRRRRLAVVLAFGLAVTASAISVVARLAT